MHNSTGENSNDEEEWEVGAPRDDIDTKMYYRSESPRCTGSLK